MEIFPFFFPVSQPDRRADHLLRLRQTCTAGARNTFQQRRFHFSGVKKADYSVFSVIAAPSDDLRLRASSARLLPVPAICGKVGKRRIYKNIQFRPETPAQLRQFLPGLSRFGAAMQQFPQYFRKRNKRTKALSRTGRSRAIRQFQNAVQHADGQGVCRTPDRYCSVSCTPEVQGTTLPRAMSVQMVICLRREKIPGYPRTRRFLPSGPQACRHRKEDRKTTVASRARFSPE